jgi:hypothetical protein
VLTHFQRGQGVEAQVAERPAGLDLLGGSVAKHRCGPAPDQVGKHLDLPGLGEARQLLGQAAVGQLIARGAVLLRQLRDVGQFSQERAGRGRKPAPVRVHHR